MVYALSHQKLDEPQYGIILLQAVISCHHCCFEQERHRTSMSNDQCINLCTTGFKHFVDMQVLIIKLAVDQVRSFYTLLFESDCDRCNGTGKLICKHCHGSKILRRWPGVLSVSLMETEEAVRPDNQK